MRATLTVLSATLTALLAAPAAAGAASTGTPPPVPTPGGPPPPVEPTVPGPTNVDALDVAVRPDGATRHGVRISFDRTSRAAEGGKPAAATQFVFLFDKSVRFHPAAFPTCEVEAFLARGAVACPDGSQVGDGTATYPDRSVAVAVFNTRYDDGSRGVLITVPSARIALRNTFEPVTGSYRHHYRWGSDELLPSPLPPAERAATIRFQVTFGASYGGRSYVESTAKPGTPLRFGLWSRFVTGQIALPTTTAASPA
ncbi:hypothetical protein [Cryptosporangium aurantiacum]|uniref:Uncharacterized protein n=1 Tax=Cryptosporangium aurantiacum TaxID=134849 RepID=A0A1M7RP01_9ACTN|nr:hypothetical protein [Cryptosporangium aurantiacum]SHN47949.1 hypothetical protein SAMN05443668_13052 [Cryptosporangium aurantiacum]